MSGDAALGAVLVIWLGFVYGASRRLSADSLPRFLRGDAAAGLPNEARVREAVARYLADERDPHEAAAWLDRELDVVVLGRSDPDVESAEAERRLLDHFQRTYALARSYHGWR